MSVAPERESGPCRWELTRRMERETEDEGKGEQGREERKRKKGNMNMKLWREMRYFRDSIGRMVNAQQESEPRTLDSRG